MSTTDRVDSAQATVWNGVAGRALVDLQDTLDQMFRPFESILVETVSGRPHCRVLDVGCGTCATTVAISRLLGPSGQAIGIDISEPMIKAAIACSQKENARACFICGNSQTHDFEAARFDSIISRFGVMFFNNPVHAVTNLRRTATNGAEIRFVAWRSPAENQFMTTAERAAASLLTELPDREPNAPGQFAFSDRHRVQAILEDSGWTHVDIQPMDRECTLPEMELVQYLTRLGPVGLVLHNAVVRARVLVIDKVRTAFEPYIAGTQVRFTAACWTVSARCAQ